MRETAYEFPKQNVITSDNGTEINAIIYFQITDPVRSVYEISNLPGMLSRSLLKPPLRNVIGELDLDQTLTSRDTINSKLRSVLDDAGQKWGVKVNRRVARYQPSAKFVGNGEANAQSVTSVQ